MPGVLQAGSMTQVTVLMGEESRDMTQQLEGSFLILQMTSFQNVASERNVPDLQLPRAPPQDAATSMQFLYCYRLLLCRV